MEAATSSYSTTGEFLRYIHSVLVVKNHQKIRSTYLVHEFYLTDIFFIPVFMAVALFCYYKNVHRAMRTTIIPP